MKRTEGISNSGLSDLGRTALSAQDARAAEAGRANPTEAATIVRGEIIDYWVKQCLWERPDAVVVEIGAGLDDRFKRVDNGTVRWFDLDREDVMAERRKTIFPDQRRTFVVGSVLEAAWIDQVAGAATNRPVLFVAAGVISFLSEAQAKSLAAMLARSFPGCSLVFDVVSPLVVGLQWFHDFLPGTGAAWKWGIRDIREMQTWPGACRVEESVNTRQMRRLPEFRECYNSLGLAQRVVGVLDPIHTVAWVTLGPRPQAVLTPKKGSLAQFRQRQWRPVGW